MKALEEKILKEGKVFAGDILNVGSFLNQQIDPAFMTEMAEEVYRLFSGEKITKVLTIESSGIAFGFAVARRFGTNLVFAKKSRTSNQNSDLLTAVIHSFTHGNDYTATVSAEYLSEGDNVLIVDDFLANGQALKGLIKIVHEAGAEVAGCVAAIEKGFQKGGDSIRGSGIRVESLAIIESMSDAGITFRPQ